jgi:hypothetical protein
MILVIKLRRGKGTQAIQPVVVPWVDLDGSAKGCF